MRRTHIVNQECKGINLAIYLINKYEDKPFTFKGLKSKYFGLRVKELIRLIQKELDNMLLIYRYTTRSKEYTDSKGVPQLEIKLIGQASMMNRYHLLDIELDIKTERNHKMSFD